jgi:hypothetical protein
MMPKKLTLSFISSFTWGQTPRQQDNKTQTCHLGDNDIQLSVRNKDLRLLVLWSLDAYMLWPKKSWNSLSLSLSLSRTIYLNAKFYNQPTQKLGISFCPEFSKSTKTPKSHRISIQNSLSVQIPTNPKTQRSWNSLKNSLSLSLSLCKFYRSTKPKTPKIMSSSPE